MIDLLIVHLAKVKHCVESVRIWSLVWSVFCRINLCIQRKYRKIRTTKTPYSENFTQRKITGWGQERLHAILVCLLNTVKTRFYPVDSEIHLLSKKWREEIYKVDFILQKVFFNPDLSYPGSRQRIWKAFPGILGLFF